MTTFGTLLREWRTTRRFSQLGLSMASGASARHISFLESGRASPSRSMVLRLAETLELPRPITNNALLAAGYAPAYVELSPDDERLGAVTMAMRSLLKNHEPYPAVVFDGRWILRDANDAAAKLFAPLGLTVGDNLLGATIALGVEGGPLTNWCEVADLIAVRLRTEIAQAGGDPHLEALLRQLCDRREALGDSVQQPANGDAYAMAPVVPIRLRYADQRLAMFSMIAQFGSVQEIAVADLRIELYFPEDEATRHFFNAMHATSTTGQAARAPGPAKSAAPEATRHARTERAARRGRR